MRALPVFALLPMLAAPWAPARGDSPPGDEEIVELRINGQDAGATLFVRRDDERCAVIARRGPRGACGFGRPRWRPCCVDGIAYFRIDAGDGRGCALRRGHAERGPDSARPTPSCQPSRHLPDDAFRASDGLPGRVPELQPVDPAASPVATRAARCSNSGFSAQHGRGYEHDARARRRCERRGTTRLDTTWTRDMPERLATLRVGDGISAPGAWGRAVRFGGVQFGTNFATQPTLITTPLLAARGEAVVPSTVDVFINGRPVASEVVPPGPFAIENLPAITGDGRAAGRRHRCARPTAGPRPAVLLGVHAAACRAATNTHSRSGRSARTMVSRASPMASCLPRATVPPRNHGHVHRGSPRRDAGRRRQCAGARHGLAGRDAGRRSR